MKSILYLSFFFLINTAQAQVSSSLIENKTTRGSVPLEINHNKLTKASLLMEQVEDKATKLLEKAAKEKDSFFMKTPTSTDPIRPEDFKVYNYHVPLDNSKER